MHLTVSSKLLAWDHPKTVDNTLKFHNSTQRKEMLDITALLQLSVTHALHYVIKKSINVDNILTVQYHFM